MGTKKVFTKMDLRWGYNNVRIKEGNEWKAAFMMPEGSFEPTVMFFGLTNSLATFQTMMNELLRDLIVMSIRTLTIFFSFLLFYFIFPNFTFLFLFLYFFTSLERR